MENTHTQHKQRSWVYIYKYYSIIIYYAVQYMRCSSNSSSSWQHREGIISVRYYYQPYTLSYLRRWYSLLLSHRCSIINPTTISIKCLHNKSFDKIRRTKIYFGHVVSRRTCHMWKNRLDKDGRCEVHPTENYVEVGRMKKAVAPDERLKTIVVIVVGCASSLAAPFHEMYASFDL